MKVIDLRNRTIFVNDIIQIYIDENYNPIRYDIQTKNGTYIVSREEYFKVRNYLLSLNDEVEIIEEDKKIEPKPITKKDLEAIGYAFGEMKKALQNGWDKSLKNEPFKEDKKIETINSFTSNVGVVDETNIEEYIHKLFEQELILYFKINEIIDYINRGD